MKKTSNKSAAREYQKQCAQEYFLAASGVAGTFALKYYKIRTNEINFSWVGDDFSSCMINDDYWSVPDMAQALFHRVKREHVFAYANCLDVHRPSFRKFLSELKK